MPLTKGIRTPIVADLPDNETRMVIAVVGASENYILMFLRSLSLRTAYYSVTTTPLQFTNAAALELPLHDHVTRLST